MIKTIRNSIIILLVGVVLFFVLSNAWIIFSTQNQVFPSIEHIPTTDVALVLGTSKRLKNGEANPYFDYRIEAADRLYKAGKVKHLILSGDNQTRYYNEPQYMKDALLKKGIPANAITLDFAGLRTLDSVVRCKEIFGQSEFIIITQKFHSYRAVFIANQFDINATAFVAENISISKSFSVVSREFLARPKAVLDIFFFKVGPKFLGEKEDVNVI